MIQIFMKEKNFNPQNKFSYALLLTVWNQQCVEIKTKIDLNIHILTVSVQEISVLQANGRVERGRSGEAHT